MADPKFTKGPWRPLLNGAEDTSVASPGGIIADVRCIDDYPSHEQVDANATLIAASPTLYEALQRICGDFRGTIKANHKPGCDCNYCFAIAALERAEGSSS